MDVDSLVTNRTTESRPLAGQVPEAPTAPAVAPRPRRARLSASRPNSATAAAMAQVPAVRHSRLRHPRRSRQSAPERCPPIWIEAQWRGAGPSQPTYWSRLSGPYMRSALCFFSPLFPIHVTNVIACLATPHPPPLSEAFGPVAGRPFSPSAHPTLHTIVISRSVRGGWGHRGIATRRAPASG